MDAQFLLLTLYQDRYAEVSFRIRSIAIQSDNRRHLKSNSHRPGPAATAIKAAQHRPNLNNEPRHCQNLAIQFAVIEYEARKTIR